MKKLAISRRQIPLSEVQAEIEKVVAKLLALDPLKIFLVGSAATGKLTDQSDLDFLLVFATKSQLRAAQKKLGPKYPLADWPVELVWMDLANFESKKKVGGIAFTAWNEGIKLFPKDSGDKQEIV